MSFTKRDRKLQSESGNVFPDSKTREPLGSSGFATLVAKALHREFGTKNAAIKTVVKLTQANERTVKNWFSAKNGPGGPHLVALMRHSDEVLEAFLLSAGRRDLLIVKKFTDARRTLQRMLHLLDEFDRQFQPDDGK